MNVSDAKHLKDLRAMNAQLTNATFEKMESLKPLQKSGDCTGKMRAGSTWPARSA